jgi:hypothetical protein
MFLLQTYTGTNVINKVQTYSNVLSIPVKMFFNHLTAWLKQYRKKTSTVKKFKTVNGSELKKKKNRPMAIHGSSKHTTSNQNGQSW